MFFIALPVEERPPSYFADPAFSYDQSSVEQQKEHSGLAKRYATDVE